MTGASGSRDGSQHIVVDMLGLLLAVTVTSAAAGDGAAAPQVPKKAANFGVRQVAWMPLAVEQDEPRRPVHIGPDGLHRMPALRCSLLEHIE